jgi:hypothetical protein
MAVRSQVFPTTALRAAPVNALGGAPADTVPFQVQPQVQTQWCWAAVSASIAAYFDAGTAWSQCQVASAEWGGAPCCTDGGSRACNRQNVLDGPLARVGHLRQLANGYLAPNAVAAEMRAGLPLPIRVQWASGGGHFVAINGIRMTGAGVQLMVTDPIYGQSVVLGDALLHNGYLSAGGRWTHSYTVQP